MELHTSDHATLQPTPLVATTKARRLLVAEDDVHMRDLIVAALRQDGAEIVEATGGVDLLEWAELVACSPDRHVFDAIISDIQMPDLTALDVLRKVPGVTRSSPVILITAFGDKMVSDDAYNLGARVLLRKPLQIGDLRAVVRSVVRFTT